MNFPTEQLYYFNEDEHIVLHPGMTEATLTQEQMRELLEQLIMGRCPFCYNLIPEEDKVCNRCLDEIAEYWYDHHSFSIP